MNNPALKNNPYTFGKILRILLLSLLAVMASNGRAEDITAVFIQPSAPLAAGNQCSLWLYSMNNSTDKAVYRFQPTLNGTLTSALGTSRTVLRISGSVSALEATLPPGGFARKEYLFTVPIASGNFALEIDNYNRIEIVVQNDSRPQVREAAPATNAVAEVPEKKRGAAAPVTDFLAKHLSTYEPIYFMLGSYPAAEFQFSLKFQVFSFENEHNFFENGLDHFFFGFTQTSFWDLFSKDPSFYDTSYKPSAFLYYTNVFQNTNDGIFRLDLQGGGEHESNGRGGTEERSLYTGYLQPTANFDLPGNFTFALQPRARFYYLVGHNNPDIADYRGYADLLGSLTWSDPKSGEKIQFATKADIGDTGRHLGMKYDLRFNLAGVPWLSAFNPTIQLQYFTGYGQTLRLYNESSKSYRAGLCLWFF